MLIVEGFSGLDDKESIEYVVGAFDESLVSFAEMFDYIIFVFLFEWCVFEIVVVLMYYVGVCDFFVCLSLSFNIFNGDMVVTVKWG